MRSRIYLSTARIAKRSRSTNAGNKSKALYGPGNKILANPSQQAATQQSMSKQYLDNYIDLKIQSSRHRNNAITVDRRLRTQPADNKAVFQYQSVHRGTTSQISGGPETSSICSNCI